MSTHVKSQSKRTSNRTATKSRKPAPKHPRQGKRVGRSNAPKSAPKQKHASNSNSPRVPYSISTTPPKRIQSGMQGRVRPISLFPDESAPAAFSGNPLNKRYMSLNGDMFTGIKMRVRIPFADVVDASAPTTTVPTGGMLVTGYVSAGTSATALTNTSVICLNPAYGYCVSNSTLTSTAKIQCMSQPIGLSVTDIALAFAEFRCLSLSFHHEGAGVTAQDRKYVFAYSTDACSPFVGIRSQFSQLEGQPISRSPIALQNQPRATLEQSANSVLFANWQSWSLDVPPDSSWKRVWAPAVYTEALQYGPYNIATVRDVHHGAICCYNLTGNAGGVQGRIWMEAEYEFRDALPQTGTPLVSAGPPLIDPSSRRPGDAPEKDTRRPLEGKSEEKSDDEVPESKEEKKEQNYKDLPQGKAYYTVTDRSQTTVKVTTDDDDEPEVISPPRYGTPVTVPGSSDYTPRSTLETQKVASGKGTSSYAKKK